MNTIEAATRGFALGEPEWTTVFVDETPGGVGQLEARATIREAVHPGGHTLELAYLLAPNGERWVQCQKVESPVRLLDSIEYRLRLTVQGDGPRDWCELRQARATGERWSSLFRPTFAELDEAAETDVAGELRRAGALHVGTREAVLGDRSRRAGFPCVVFERGNEDVPFLSFLFTRALPLLA
jgi:hypothetical protein